MDTIEREIVIAAPPERVYAIVTQPEHMGQWFGDAGAEREGDVITMRWAEYGAAGAAGGERGPAAVRSPTAGTRRPRSATRSSSSRSRPTATGRG